MSSKNSWVFLLTEKKITKSALEAKKLHQVITIDFTAYFALFRHNTYQAWWWDLKSRARSGQIFPSSLSCDDRFFSCEDMFFLLTLQYLAERRFKLTTGESNSRENCFTWGNRNSSRFPSTRESTSMVSTTVVMEETWDIILRHYFALVNNDHRNPSFIFPKMLSWRVSLPFSEMNFTRF